MAYILKLYISNHTPTSERAIKNLEKIVSQIKGVYKIEIIDILKKPELAEKEKILATPLLKKNKHRAKIIGDLGDTHKVILSLNLTPKTGGKT